MKKQLRGIQCLVFIFLLLLSGCAGKEAHSDNKAQVNKNEEIISENGKQNLVFAIVLVKGMSTFEAMNCKLEELQLDTNPLLTDEDVITYQPNQGELLLRHGLKLADGVPVDGLPFVVIANNKRIYLGAFWTPVSSLRNPNIPLVSVMQPYDNIDKIHLYGDDVINNALKSVGKIKDTTTQYATDYNTLVNAIKAKGYQVKEIESQDGTHSLFSVTPKAMKLNDEFLTVYEFADNDTAKSQAKTISSDGSKIGYAIIDWISVPHFYLQGKIIVSYIGRNGVILSDLEKIFGKPITDT